MKVHNGDSYKYAVLTLEAFKREVREFRVIFRILAVATWVAALYLIVRVFGSLFGSSTLWELAISAGIWLALVALARTVRAARDRTVRQLNAITRFIRKKYGE